MRKIQVGFFDEQEKLDRLSKLGDPLERLNKQIEWEIFRPKLIKVIQKEGKGPGGRPPFDYILMFKILILQEYFGLSDEQMEYQITDRFSFMRFLGIRTYEKVPDQNTIWNFREQLKENDVIKKLFNLFKKELEKVGMILNKGKIIDASIVEVPKQRNKREENQQIKQGIIPGEWESNPNKLSHKDTDARWVKKNGEKYYGYKNSIKIDSKKKFIDDYEVSDASEHDSQPGKKLLNKKDKGQPIYGDGAYTGEDFEKAIDKCGMINKINEKGYRNKPLTKRQKLRNKSKSKVRARVEHVFGYITQSVYNPIICTIGKARAKIKIGLRNLIYNLFRYTYYKQLAVGKHA